MECGSGVNALMSGVTVHVARLGVSGLSRLIFPPMKLCVNAHRISTACFESAFAAFNVGADCVLCGDGPCATYTQSNYL